MTTNLQDIKEKLYDFITAGEEEFVIYNSQGGVVKELSLNEVEDAIGNCDTMNELRFLIMNEWLYKDVYESFNELVQDITWEDSAI